MNREMERKNERNDVGDGYCLAGDSERNGIIMEL